MCLTVNALLTGEEFKLLFLCTAGSYPNLITNDVLSEYVLTSIEAKTLDLFDPKTQTKRSIPLPENREGDALMLAWAENQASGLPITVRVRDLRWEGKDSQEQIVSLLVDFFVWMYTECRHFRVKETIEL